MRRLLTLLPLVALAVACAGTPKQRIFKAAKAVKATNESAATALDYDLIEPEQAEIVQGITRTATADLKRAAAALKAVEAGEAKEVSTIDRILAIVHDALQEAARIIGTEEQIE